MSDALGNKMQSYWEKNRYNIVGAENGATRARMDSSIPDEWYVYNDLVPRKPDELQLCSLLQIPTEVHSVGWKLWLLRWTDSCKQHSSGVE